MSPIRLAAILVAMLALVSGSVVAQAPMPHSDDPGDCATCHGDAAMLPSGHVPTAGMARETCVACHQAGTPLALNSSVFPLDHHHLLSG